LDSYGNQVICDLLIRFKQGANMVIGIPLGNGRRGLFDN